MSNMTRGKHEISTLFRTEDFDKEFGVISLQMWPEGLVLFVGGEIKVKNSINSLMTMLEGL